MDNDVELTKVGGSWRSINNKKKVRFYGTTPIYSALAKLHNFTEDAKELLFINWASIQPKIQGLPSTLIKGLEGIMKKEEEESIIPCCGKNFGLINDSEIDLREYGIKNRKRVTTVYCEGQDLCSNRESMFGMNSCGHYSASKEIKEL